MGLRLGGVTVRRCFATQRALALVLVVGTAVAGCSAANAPAPPTLVAAPVASPTSDTNACALAGAAVERAYAALLRGDQRAYEASVDTLLRSRPHHLMGEDIELLDMTYTVTDCREAWAEVTIGGRIRLVGGPEDDVSGSIEIVHRVGDEWLVSTAVERQNDPAWPR